MHFYQHNIKDFRSGTINMSREARWIYRDMMDVYYDREGPLPLDLDALCDELGVDTPEQRTMVERILRMKFQRTDAGYCNARCEAEIKAYHGKAETARANGKLGGRPPKTKQETGGNPAGTGSKTNQEPRTNNQKPKKQSAYSAEFEFAWSDYPSRPGDSKAKAFAAWNARLKEGVKAEDLHAGVKRYAAYVKAERTEPRYIKQAATFFGPGDHYSNAWAASPRAGGPVENERMRTSYDREADRLLAEENAKRRGLQPPADPQDPILF